MDDFSSRRRQRFLDEAYFKWMLASLSDRIAYWSENIAPTGETEDEREATTQLYRSSDCYPGMTAAPGHDSHLDAKKGGKGAYAGYWAIEAAAAAYLLQLDDSSFHNHLLYPKDLADFARTFEA